MLPTSSFEPQAQREPGRPAAVDPGDRLESGKIDEAAHDHERLLLGELSHRVKNTLTVVLAIVRRTSRHGGDLAAFTAALEGRLHALAIAHELLAASGWRQVELAELIRRAVGSELRSGRIRLAIGPIDVPPSLAQTLVMVLHELLDNAVRHGALAAATGHVDVEARARGGEVELLWRETGGPAPDPLAEEGFGITMVTRAVPHQHGGRVDLDWAPEGLVCRLHVPLAHPDSDSA